jgi:hypothetical protein
MKHQTLNPKPSALTRSAKGGMSSQSESLLTRHVSNHEADG